MTALQGDRNQVDPSELLATLPRMDDRAEGGDLEAERSALAPVKIGRADPSTEGEDLACTDFLKAACSLAIGVGLTSSPLYPDLMALVRTWLPNRLRRGSLSPAARSGRMRPCVSWQDGLDADRADRCPALPPQGIEPVLRPCQSVGEESFILWSQPPRNV